MFRACVDLLKDVPSRALRGATTQELHKLVALFDEEQEEAAKLMKTLR